MGGQVALVQGALFARSEATLAIERLDDARLLLPGTLVEEAALRREILLVGQAEDFDKFEFLTLAYIRHYRQLGLCGDFWQRFSSGLTQSSLALDERRFARIVTLLEQIDRASRLKLYFAIARSAMLRGRLAVTELAGERALVLSADASADRERAHFFRGVARVLTDEYDGGLAELKALDRSKLPERDIPLLNATVQLALDVRKPFAGGPAAAADKPPVTPARLDLASSTATLARAQKQLATSNASPRIAVHDEAQWNLGTGLFGAGRKPQYSRHVAIRQERRSEVVGGFVVQRPAPHRLEPREAGAERRRRRHGREGGIIADTPGAPDREDKTNDETVNERTETADEPKSAHKSSDQKVDETSQTPGPVDSAPKADVSNRSAFPRLSGRSWPPYR